MKRFKVTEFTSPVVATISLLEIFSDINVEYGLLVSLLIVQIVAIIFDTVTDNYGKTK